MNRIICADCDQANWKCACKTQIPTGISAYKAADGSTESSYTPKQAWWSGYRAGKGLPADTPRQQAINRSDEPQVRDDLDFLITSVANAAYACGACDSVNRPEEFQRLGKLTAERHANLFNYVIAKLYGRSN